MQERELIIVGGPNGSGKTTFALSFLKEKKGFEFLNADEIAKELSKEKSSGGNITAGKEYFRRLSLAKEKNKSVLIESTMSGLFLEKLLKDFKKAGYQIKVIFIVLNSPELCIQRIRHRVSLGGHNVPEEDVKRRFARGKSHFWESYRDLAAQWLLYNNTETGYELVAVGEKSNYKIVHESFFSDFIKTLDNEQV